MVRFPAGTRNFHLLQGVRIDSGTNTASYSMDTGGSLPWDKAAGTWSLPLSSVKVKNESNQTSLPKSDSWSLLVTRVKEFKDCLNPEEGADLIVPKSRWLDTNLRCKTSQKSEYLVYTAAEAWNRIRTSHYSVSTCTCLTTMSLTQSIKRRTVEWFMNDDVMSDWFENLENVGLKFWHLLIWF